MSKIIQIFLNFFIEEYQFGGMFFCYWHFLKTSIFEAIYFLKMSPIFVGSEVVRSSLYQKIFSLGLLIYIYLDCVRRSSWFATTLDTLAWISSMYMHFVLNFFKVCTLCLVLHCSLVKVKCPFTSFINMTFYKNRQPPLMYVLFVDKEGVKTWFSF